MSIANYSELQTAVSNWLDREDLSSMIPDFISLAEARIARSLRSRGVEERATTVLVAGQEYYSLPTDFLEARRVKINSNPIRVLDYKTPTQITDMFPDSSGGVSRYYTIIGEEIQLKPSPNSTDTLEIAYFTKLPPLSDSNLTNWLTANAPDLLLYGSLIEAEAYLVNDPRIAIWRGAFEESINEWNLQDERARFSGHPLETSVKFSP